MVTATDADGRTAHDERYSLLPGEVRCEFGVFDSGAREVRVVLGNRRTAGARVRIEDPTDGALVEVGNGAVSVHDGLFG